MKEHHQNGFLRCSKRKSGPSCWEFLWRETDQTGKRTRRTVVIGTIEQYPTRELADMAANGLRVQFNENPYRQTGRNIFVADLVDHYMQTELSEEPALQHWVTAVGWK